MRLQKQKIQKWMSLVFGVAALALGISGLPLSAHASSINEIQKQIEEHQKDLEAANEKVSNLKDQQSLIEEMIDDLNAEIINTMTSIGLKEDEIAEKEEEIGEKILQIQQKSEDIDLKESEYLDMKNREERQQEDMQIRVRRIYENGTNSLLSMVLRGAGFGSLLNRMEYVEQLYSYDRNRLSDYQAMKQLVSDLKEKLETEKQALEEAKAQLETDKAQLELAKKELDEQKDELDKALAVRKKQSANFDAEINKAKQEASVAKKLIQQEQKELKRLQDEQMKGNTAAATGTYTSNSYTSIIDNATGSDMGKRVAKYACQYIGNPYVYGGTSLTNGTDCSGFTWRVYKDFGYSISRTSGEQRKDGTDVKYADAQPGDLICYSGHVGIYIGGGKIVHASNKKDGIKVSNATYRSILAVRRIL